MDITEKTSAEYMRIAENWLIKHVDGLGVQRTSKAISIALGKWSHGKRPATFRKMRRALVHHQQETGFQNAASRIEQVRRIGHGKANTKKRKRCKHINESEHQILLDDAIARDDHIMQAALSVAYLTGIRPVEMPSVRVLEIQKDTGRIILSVSGAKKNERQGRGIDKQVAVDDPDIIRAVEIIRGIDEKELAALKRRVSRRSHTLWPRRKNPPTLYSYRHQMGTDLKANSRVDNEHASAIMGHRAQDSIHVYGHKNSRGGLNRSLPGVSKQTVEKVLKRDPKLIPCEQEQRARKHLQRNSGLKS